MASLELGNTERQWEEQPGKVTVPHVQCECVQVWNPAFCHLEVVENGSLCLSGETRGILHQSTKLIRAPTSLGHLTTVLPLAWYYT